MKNSSHYLLSCLEAKEKYAVLNLDALTFREEDDFNQNEKILVFTESVEVDVISLDFEDFTFKHLLDHPDTDILTIIIEGHLTVKESISCYETDGSTGMVVLGNVSAKNIVIGGHQFYVQGNLNVQEIVCGHYNHGSMMVLGDASAKYFIPDDYAIFIAGIVEGIVVGENIFKFDPSEAAYHENPILPAVTMDEVLKEEFMNDEEGYFLFDSLVDAIREGNVVYASKEPLYVIRAIELMVDFSWERTYLTKAHLKLAIWSFPHHIFTSINSNNDDVEFKKNDGFENLFFHITRAREDEHLQPLHQKASLYLIDKKNNDHFYMAMDSDTFHLFYNEGENFIPIDAKDFVRLTALQDTFVNYLRVMYAEITIQELFSFDRIENLRQQMLLHVKEEHGFRRGIYYVGASNENDNANLLWIIPIDLENIYFELQNNFVSIYFQENDNEMRYITSVYDIDKITKAKKYLERTTKLLEEYVIQRDNRIENIESALQVWAACFKHSEEFQIFETILKQAVYDPKSFILENPIIINAFENEYEETISFTDDVILGIALIKCLETTNFCIEIPDETPFNEALVLLKPFLDTNLNIDFDKKYVTSMQDEDVLQNENYQKIYSKTPNFINFISSASVDQSKKLNNSHIVGLNKKLSQEQNEYSILYLEFYASGSPKYLFKVPCIDAEKIVAINNDIYSFSIQGLSDDY